MAFFKKTRERIHSSITSSMGLSSLSLVAKTIQSQASTLFIPKVGRTKETFEDARRRFGFSDTDLARLQKTFLHLSITFVIFLMLTLAYMVYMLVIGAFHAALVSLGIAFVITGLTFRYHFWWFQIKKGKLGCTFKEWFSYLLSGAK